MDDISVLGAGGWASYRMKTKMNSGKMNVSLYSIPGKPDLNRIPYYRWVSDIFIPVINSAT